MKRYWIRGFTGIALALLAVAVLGVYAWTARDSAEARRQLTGGTRMLAQTVAANLAHIRGVLSAMRMDAGLRDAFAAREPEHLQALEQGLMARVPDAIGIHLFPSEQTNSVEGIPFMSYAGLELVREAGQSESVTLLEVHKVGKADRHLAVAAPVLDVGGKETVGVVYAALPISLLQSPPDSLMALGTVGYQQVVGTAAANLQGSVTPPDRRPDYEEKIGGTRLQVAAWVVGRGLVEPWLAAMVAGTYLFVVAVIGAILWGGYRGIKRDLMADCQGVAVLVDDAVHHRPLRRLKSRLAETQGVHAEVFAALRSLKPSRAPIRGAEPSSSTSSRLGPSSYLSEASVEVEEIDLPDSFDGAADGGMGSSASVHNPLKEFDALEQLESLKDEPVGRAAAGQKVPREIFRAYDIRGLVGKQLTQDAMRAIGQALGSEAATAGDGALMLGRDCRASSQNLSNALSDGIRAAGVDVVDLGVVPTPLIYFACCHPEVHSGAMVTASHNPPEYNGVKAVLMGESPDSAAISALYQRIAQGKLTVGAGRYETDDIVATYREYVEQDVALARNLKLVVDCGNATTAILAPELFRSLGCEVIELNCDMDAGMSETMPDPAVPELMQGLGDLVLASGADVGLAFDGDGDRLGVVDSQGRFIAADRVMMLLAGDILTRNPGTDVVFDVKCTRHLAEEIRRSGGRPVMCRSGHAPIKAQLRESGALIAGELSGHIMFKERWFGFDDAIYAGARLLEVLSLDPRPSQEIFAALPGGIATPEIYLPLSEGEPTRIMESVRNLANRLDGVDVILIDGLRAEFDRGWGLVRASNTQPNLTFRFEGDDQESIEKIQALFRRLMEKAAPGLSLPF